MAPVIRSALIGVLATPAVLVHCTAPAKACTVCDGASGREVRERLIDGDVALPLLAAALPFLAVGAVVAAVHFGVPFIRKERRDGNVRH